MDTTGYTKSRHAVATWSFDADPAFWIEEWVPDGLYAAWRGEDRLPPTVGSFEAAAAVVRRVRAAEGGTLEERLAVALELVDGFDSLDRTVCLERLRAVLTVPQPAET